MEDRSILYIVTVLGATSNTLPISSDVPEGSILGSVLFLLYVDELSDSVTTSKVAMFAVIRSYSGRSNVKAMRCYSKTILEHWSSISGLTFDESKYKQQQITRKITPITSTYMLNDQQLDTTDTERDVGLCVSSNLTWRVQVRQQVSKAGKLMGYIRRNTMFVTDITPRRSLYLALVHSHFGYGSQIWTPQAIDLINMLKRTQRPATKLISNLPFSTDVDYRKRLISIRLLPVSYTFFKITHGLVETSVSIATVII